MNQKLTYMRNSALLYTATAFALLLSINWAWNVSGLLAVILIQMLFVAATVAVAQWALWADERGRQACMRRHPAGRRGNL